MCITERTKRLAELLTSYENDEPHPFGDETEEEQRYPDRPWTDIAKELSRPHSGDCIRECHVCQRCMAEWVLHKARWIDARLDAKGGEQ